MANLVCWSCGFSLKDIPLPFTRLEQCKACRADLHVCRLCRYYNPNVFDKCDHEMAEPARDATVANFCHYFRPKANAFTQDKKSKADEAMEQLKSLFGVSEDNKDTTSTVVDAKNDLEKAKAKFDDLFKSSDD